MTWTTAFAATPIVTATAEAPSGGEVPVIVTARSTTAADVRTTTNRVKMVIAQEAT